MQTGCCFCVVLTPDNATSGTHSTVNHVAADFLAWATMGGSSLICCVNARGRAWRSIDSSKRRWSVSAAARLWSKTNTSGLLTMLASWRFSKALSVSPTARGAAIAAAYFGGNPWRHDTERIQYRPSSLISIFLIIIICIINITLLRLFSVIQTQNSSLDY